MKNESDLRQEMNRGFEAEKILKHPLVVEYFTNRKSVIIHNLETCKHWENTSERDALLNMLQCFADFEKSFKEEIKSGKKAESKLKELMNKITRL